MIDTPHESQIPKNDERAGEDKSKDGLPSKKTVSIDLVKSIMEDAIEQNLALEKKTKNLQLALQEPSASVKLAAEALARAADSSAVRDFEEQMADAHKAMEQAMAPFFSELTRMTELANLAAPQLIAMESLEKISAFNLPVARDLLKIQTDMENQAKLLFQGLRLDGINFPLTELTSVTLPREQTVPIRQTIPAEPVSPKEPMISKQQYEADIIKVSKLAVYEVMQETKIRSLNKYKKDVDIIGMPLPDKIDWPQITIRFLNGHAVYILAEGKTTESAYRTYKEMGFEDRHKRLPDVQWELLRILADYHGIITWKNPKADFKIKKQKELLAKALMYYFDIPTDPFEVYRKTHGYKIKLILLPESGGPSGITDSRLEGMGDVFGE